MTREDDCAATTLPLAGPEQLASGLCLLEEEGPPPQPCEQGPCAPALVVQSTLVLCFIICLYKSTLSRLRIEYTSMTTVMKAY